MRAAAQADSNHAKDERQQEERGVPVEHRTHPAGRVGQVLSAPQRHQRGHDEALEAEHKEELAAPPTAVEGLDLLRSQRAFLDWDQGVGQGLPPCVCRRTRIRSQTGARRCSRFLGIYRNATDWIPATSKRLRQRMFLQPTRSSVRTM